MLNIKQKELINFLCEYDCEHNNTHVYEFSYYEKVANRIILYIREKEIECLENPLIKTHIIENPDVSKTDNLSK